MCQETSRTRSVFCVFTNPGRTRMGLGAGVRAGPVAPTGLFEGGLAAALNALVQAGCLHPRVSYCSWPVFC